MALLDTSALVKLVVHENRTSELQSWLVGDVVPAASALVRVELRRAAQRLDVQLQPFVEQVLARLHLLRLDDDVLDLAARWRRRRCAAWTRCTSPPRSARVSTSSSATTSGWSTAHAGPECAP